MNVMLVVIRHNVKLFNGSQLANEKVHSLHVSAIKFIG